MQVPIRLVPLMLIVAAAPSFAAVSADRHVIGADGGVDRLKGPVIGWTLSETGEVSLTQNHCPGCRGLRIDFYRFNVDTATLARLDSLIPDELIEAATRAPCTLRNAEAGWAQRVAIRSFKGGGGSHRGYFMECRSPELTTLRKRLDAFATVLMGEIARQKIEPDRRY